MTRKVEAETQEDKIRHSRQEIFDIVQLGNGGFGGSISVSFRVAAEKKASHPYYRMQEHKNRNGVLTSLLDA